MQVVVRAAAPQEVDGRDHDADGGADAEEEKPSRVAAR